MSHNLLFVANWKMQLSYNQSLAYIELDKKNLSKLAQNNSIIICPSFEALTATTILLNGTKVHIGAQDVSAHTQGAYTGQVSAISLKEVGCSYCIVGHSERRQHNGETNEKIAQKAAQLITQNIIPIVCIGETEKQRLQGITIDALQEQLKPVIDTLKSTAPKNVCIAYEPVWAIGSGTTPSTDEIDQILNWIDQELSNTLPETNRCLLYGGSVTPENAKVLAGIEGIGGFLIGGSSTDFQKFEKIVSLENI